MALVCVGFARSWCSRFCVYRPNACNCCFRRRWKEAAACTLGNTAGPPVAAAHTLDTRSILLRLRPSPCHCHLLPIPQAQQLESQRQTAMQQLEGSATSTTGAAASAIEVDEASAGASAAAHAATGAGGAALGATVMSLDAELAAVRQDMQVWTEVWGSGGWQSREGESSSRLWEGVKVQPCQACIEDVEA